MISVDYENTKQSIEYRSTNAEDSGASCQQQIQGRRIWWAKFGFHAVDGVHEISHSLGKVLREIGSGAVWHFIVLHLNVKFPFFMIQSNEHKLIRFATSFNRPQTTIIVYLF